MGFRTYLAALVTATSIVTLAAPAHALNLFSSSGISFDKNTSVQFKFEESHGKYRSTLGIMEVLNGLPKLSSFTSLFAENAPGYDGRSNDWQASCGGSTIPLPCTTSFNFLEGKTYTLALSRPVNSNGVSSGYVYSTTQLNKFGSGGPYVQAMFTGDLYRSGMTVSFEDIGGAFNPTRCAATSSAPKGDCDFNDFIVTAKATPEPATMAGLGMVVGGLVVSRRRKKQHTA